MEKNRELVVNAGTCDARQVREETLQAYDKITLNCGTVLVSAESRGLLERYPVKINAGEVLELGADVEYVPVNGTARIAPDQGPGDKRVFLSVNGTLEVAPGSEEAVAAYTGIRVKGSILCPQSMVKALAGVQRKGRMDVYPDGSILLKPTAVLDDTFPLRARDGARYFAARRMVVLDPTLDMEELARRDIRFATGELLVAKSLARVVVPLFNEEAEITILPDGCVYCSDDVVLDGDLIRREGGSLYVRGDLTVDRDAPLDQVEFLQVKGTIRAPQALGAALQAIPRLEYGELVLTRGRVISDRVTVTIDKPLLEGAKEGISVAGCAKVRIAPDVPPRLLEEKLLKVQDCAVVSCTPDQRPVLELLIQDVAQLSDKELSAPEKEDSHRTVVNTGTYKL